MRVYQDRQLLPPPTRRGRTAIYSDAHLNRLRVIINMLERGYALAQIKEMLSAWESGRSLADVIGLEEALGASWADEAPTKVSFTELRSMFGSYVTPENIQRALDLNLLERRGSSFVAPSPGLVEAGRELVQLGVPLNQVLDLAERLQSDIDDIAGQFIRVVRSNLLDATGEGWLPTSEDELASAVELFGRVRALAQSAVSSALARSVNRVIPEMLGTTLAEAWARSQNGQGQA